MIKSSSARPPAFHRILSHAAPSSKPRALRYALHAALQISGPTSNRWLHFPLGARHAELLTAQAGGRSSCFLRAVRRSFLQLLASMGQTDAMRNFVLNLTATVVALVLWLPYRIWRWHRERTDSSVL
jgi:hypothetical protein